MEEINEEKAEHEKKVGEIGKTLYDLNINLYEEENNRWTVAIPMKRGRS